MVRVMQERLLSLPGSVELGAAAAPCAETPSVSYSGLGMSLSAKLGALLEHNSLVRCWGVRCGCMWPVSLLLALPLLPALHPRSDGEQRRKSCAFASPFVMALLSPEPPRSRLGKEGRGSSRAK